MPIAESVPPDVGLRPAHVLTFDVEDWYHPLDPEPAHWPGYEDRVSTSTRRLLEILDEAATRATFFILGDVAERHPELVVEIHEAGHEVASHGHHHRFVYRQTPAAFEADVRRSLEHLSGLVPQPILGYRAPCFSITEASRWALPVLRRLGLRYDASIFPAYNHRYGVPGAPRTIHPLPEGLVEMPPATYRRLGVNVPCGGGAYFRLLPYGLTRRMLRRIEDAGEAIVFYLHPWEVDPEQPRLGAPAPLRLRHYAALDRTADRLRALLREFRFGPARDVLPTYALSEAHA